MGLHVVAGDGDLLRLQAANIEWGEARPDVATIGQAKLQVYCDQWLQRPLARGYGIAQLSVDCELLLTVNVNPSHAAFVDNRVFFPVDELLGYIIDEQFQDADKRRQLHDQVRDLRQRWDELGREYEVTVGRVGNLYLTCKNPGCGALLETTLQAAEGQVIKGPPCDVTCPVCGHTDTYSGNDLNLRLTN